MAYYLNYETAITKEEYDQYSDEAIKAPIDRFKGDYVILDPKVMSNQEYPYSYLKSYNIFINKNRNRLEVTQIFRFGLVPLTWVPNFLRGSWIEALNTSEVLKGLPMISLKSLDLLTGKPRFRESDDKYVFLEDIAKRLNIPESEYSFGRLLNAVYNK